MTVPKPAAAGTAFRIALGVEYKGCAFHGWQAQGSTRTVQRTLEAALSRVANAQILTTCAGRTDSGVHATGQVVHFDSPVVRSPGAWVRGTNSHLPSDVRVTWCVEVDEHFHARHSAYARRYRYWILNQAVHSAIWSGLVTWYPHPLDVEPMQRAAQGLLGERDFSAYRASSCQSATAMRHVDFVEVDRQGPWVTIDIQANAFLHHMVRNIAGALLAVGNGRAPHSWPGEVLASRDRTQGAATAPPDGLYLVGVRYPRRWRLPPPEAACVP
ncbi:MAG: tRNA pseudouridine(38-40) synthase TruA [Pseudomonadota bacterium]|nr:tRNA pseudouridine(38-40) synthase TruA [Pseudomonadota bacterium]